MSAPACAYCGGPEIQPGAVEADLLEQWLAVYGARFWREPSERERAPELLQLRGIVDGEGES